MKRAVLIKELKNDPDVLWQSLYYLEDQNKYVIVSAVDIAKTLKFEKYLDCHKETYIFESNKDGDIVNYSELDGSFKGSMDHTKALGNIGYEIYEVEPKNRLELIMEE